MTFCKPLRAKCFHYCIVPMKCCFTSDMLTPGKSSKIQRYIFTSLNACNLLYRTDNVIFEYTFQLSHLSLITLPGMHAALPVACPLHSQCLLLLIVTAHSLLSVHLDARYQTLIAQPLLLDSQQCTAVCLLLCVLVSELEGVSSKSDLQIETTLFLIHLHAFCWHKHITVSQSAFLPPPSVTVPQIARSQWDRNWHLSAKLKDISKTIPSKSSLLHAYVILLSTFVPFKSV